MRSNINTRHTDQRRPTHGWLMVVVAVIAVAASTAAQAQARLDTDTIVIGDQTTLRGHWTTLGGEGIVTVSIGESGDTQTAVITCFEPGEHWIHTGEADSLLLVVRDVELDPEDTTLADIADIASVPYTIKELRWLIVLALLVLMVGFGIWHNLRHGHAAMPAAPIVARRPGDMRNPHQRATDELRELRERQLWQAGQAKLYHTELTDTVRRFIEETSGLRATDMTSDETIYEATHRGWREEAELMRSIFGTADMVKFAKSEPQAHEHERSMREAEELVERLWQRLKPQPTDEADEQARKEGSDV